jgi:hypothetical protein
MGAPDCPEGLRWALAFGPTPFDFIFGNLFGGGMFFGFEGLHFEHVSLIDGSMVQLDVVIENLRNGGFFENRLPRAFRFARAAVNAFIRMNVEHVREIFMIIADIFVNAIDRADADASGIDAIDAEPGYRPWHKSKSSLYLAPFLSPSPA